MRPHGQTKLGFFPLPVTEAKRLKNWLTFPELFSALDPCVCDGVAFFHLLQDMACERYGIEIDAYRAEQARSLDIETLQADAMEVRCPAESLSLLYLNPPYDWEAGASNKEKRRRVEALRTACQKNIADDLFPALEVAIKSKVQNGETWSLRSDDGDPDKQTLLFDYPTSFTPDATGYIRRAVKIEMGARADHWPCETKTVTPYVAEQFPQGFRKPS